MISQFDTDVEMTKEEFRMIRDFIHEKAGIFFAENKMYLVHNRLQKRMAELGMKSMRDYFYHVKYDVTQKEFNRLMVLMTTNETSFFRNEPQLLCFSDEVLPLLLAEKQKTGRQTLKFWSAGCSTGEEPYTLAMIILDRLGSINGWDIEIIANDISEDVLARARRGEYSGITMRNVRPDLLARFFEKANESYRVKDEVKAMVKFSQINLNEDRKVAMMTEMDAVFCRNVMIYFSVDVKKRLVRGFFNSLRPGGYLYIGHSETLHGISKAFKLIYFKNALVYRKETSESATGIASAVKPADLASTEPIAVSGAARAIDLLNKIKPLSAGK